MEGQTIRKSGRIHQQEDANLGRFILTTLKSSSRHMSALTIFRLPMYYIMTSVPLLQNVIPPISWTQQ